MAVFHRVFRQKKEVTINCGDFPFIINHSNQGLPDWYFKGDFFAVQINAAADTVEWVPECGPAPIWQAKLSSFKDDAEMLAALDRWYRETY